MATDLDEYHRAFGRHSLIPECCIESFIYDPMALVRSPGRDPDKKVRYVRCLTCIHDGFVKNIHNCTIKCIPFLKGIGCDTARMQRLGMLKTKLAKRRQKA